MDIKQGVVERVLGFVVPYHDQGLGLGLEPNAVQRVALVLFNFKTNGVVVVGIVRRDI